MSGCVIQKSLTRKVRDIQTHGAGVVLVRLSFRRRQRPGTAGNNVAGRPFAFDSEQQ